MKAVVTTALVALLTTASPAAAQDPSAPAAFGQGRLSAGFTPDPHTVNLTAGGTIDASELGSGCAGTIAQAPDYELTYAAGGLPLVLYVHASEDTTLVVNGPDGRWYCDDDSRGGLNPQIAFTSPGSGTYDIWVGVFDGDVTPARLHISELTTQDGSSGAPDPSLTATYGEVTLRVGFSPDPYRVRMTAGGPLPAAGLSEACQGSIAPAPDYQITYSAGALPLVFRTESSSDTTLVINGPDGRWSCDDDSGGSSNAEVRYDKPASGVYDIWVGVYSGGAVPADLVITETP
jgi:hypothetical protein